MDMVIETIILNVLSNEIFEEKGNYLRRQKIRWYKRNLIKQVREYINSHDGTILTTGAFERFLQYSKPIEKIFGHVTNAQNVLSKDGFIKEQIDNFATQNYHDNQIPHQDRTELYSFFDFCYNSINHFCSSLLLSDEQKLIISQLVENIALLKEDSDQKTESIISSTRRLESGIDELKQLIIESNQIVDSATIIGAYNSIVTSLSDGNSESVVRLLPLLKGKNSDLELCADYLIGLLSDRPSSTNFEDVQLKVNNDFLYEDVVKRSLYLALIEKNDAFFARVNNRNTELLTIAKHLQNNEHDSFYKISACEKDAGTCYQYSICSEEYPSHLWLLKRICVLDIFGSSVINAADVSANILKDDCTLIDTIIISERKAAEMVSNIMRSPENIRQLYETLFDKNEQVRHLPHSVQVKYYCTLLHLASFISVEDAKKVKELLPSFSLVNPDIQMSCLQIDVDSGLADVERIIELCNYTKKYWLLSNYFAKIINTDTDAVESLIDDHKYLISKDVNIFLIYAHIINKHEGTTAALRLLERFEETYDGFLDYWVARIKLSNINGSFDETIIEKTIQGWRTGKVSATSPEFVVIFFQLLVQAKKYNEVLELISEIEKRTPLSVELLKAKGFSLINVGREIDALKSFLEAFEINNTDEQIADNIITLCINNSRMVPPQVLNIAKTSQHSRMLMLTAICYDKSGQYDEAKRWFQKAMLRNDGENDDVFRNYLSFYTKEDHSQEQTYIMVDGNTKVSLISSDGIERPICIYKELVLPHDPYIWCGAEHIGLETAVKIGLLRKKENDTLVLDGQEYTIREIQSVDSFFFNISMQKLIDWGEAKSVQLPIDEKSNPEKMARVLKEALGDETENTQWLRQYKDLAALPVPFFVSQKNVRLSYFQLIGLIIEDPTVVYRELFNPNCERSDRFILSSAAFVALYKIGFNSKDTIASVIVPEALKQTLLDETSRVIAENNREHVASMGVIEGQLVFQESAEEEKQQQMAMAVGLKEFSSQFKGVQNENDLQIGGVEQIDCKSIFGISDYDALSLAKHEEIVLITAEPAIEAIACIPNSGVLSVGIADFLALSKIPAVKMLSCIEKMIDFRFLFPITEKVVLSLIDCYNQSESEDKKTELIQRWAKVLEKPLDDQAYAELISVHLWDLYRKIREKTDVRNPILISLLVHILRYGKITYRTMISKNGEISLLFENYNN